MSLFASFSGVFEPIIIAIISLLNQMLELGYDSLSLSDKALALKFSDLAYVALATFGEDLAQSTTNSYDDAAIREFQQAIEEIGAKEGYERLAALKSLYSGDYIAPQPRA